MRTKGTENTTQMNSIWNTQSTEYILTIIRNGNIINIRVGITYLYMPEQRFPTGGHAFVKLSKKKLSWDPPQTY